MKVSPQQRRCLIAATIEPLAEYPRGYAASKAGPFHARRIVRSLLRTGALRKVHFIGNYQRRVSARAS